MEEKDNFLLEVRMLKIYVDFHRFSSTNTDLINDTFIPELRQRLQHMLPDGFRIIIESGTDEPQAIRCQHLSMITSAELLRYALAVAVLIPAALPF